MIRALYALWLSVVLGAPAVAQARPFAWRHLPDWRDFTGHSIAFDPVRRRVVMLTSLDHQLVYSQAVYPESSETWEWDGTDWTHVPCSVAPRPRKEAAMAFDPITRRILLYGGGGTLALTDTWLWDGHQWQEVPTTSHPAGSVRASIGTDWTRQQVVLFGGTNGLRIFDETWVWTGSDWQLQSPNVRPQARYGAGHLAYDTFNQALLLYGGAAPGALADGWLWDGATWHPLPTTLSLPGARFNHAMATHGLTGEIFLFSGQWTQSNDLWRWDGRRWQAHPTATLPELRLGTRMAWDGTQLIATGGFSQHPNLRTWGLDTADWHILRDPPFFPYLGYVVYEAARDTLLGVSFDRWSMAVVRDGQEVPGRIPLPVSGDFMAHHVASGLTLLVGERYGTSVTEFWLWDGSSWRHDPNPLPPLIPTVYDSARAKLVGVSNNSREMYEWDPQGWSRVTWQGGMLLTDNDGGRAVGYDSIRQRLVVYRTTPAPTRNELWEWDGSSWQIITPATNDSPGNRSLASFAYSPALGGLILFGGSVDDLGVWLWNGRLWRRLAAEGFVPTQRGLAPSALDIVRNRLYVNYGGYGVGPSVWEVDMFPLRESNRYPRMGETITLAPEFPSEANNLLAVALSTDSRPALPVRPYAPGMWEMLPLAWTPLFPATLEIRQLDSLGRATFAYPMPVTPGLFGRRIHAAGITIRSNLTLGLITSNTELLFRR